MTVQEYCLIGGDPMEGIIATGKGVVANYAPN